MIAKKLIEAVIAGEDPSYVIESRYSDNVSKMIPNPARHAPAFIKQKLKKFVTEEDIQEFISQKYKSWMTQQNRENPEFDISWWEILIDNLTKELKKRGVEVWNPGDKLPSSW